MTERHSDERIESSAGSVRPRKRISTARLLLYLSILLVLMLVGLRLVPEVMLSWSISRIEAAGYPTDLQGFIAQFLPPPMKGVNGEPILREALSLVVEPETAVPGKVALSDQVMRMLRHRGHGLSEIERAHLLPGIGEVELSPLGLGERWPEEVIDALRDYIAANQAAIDKLRSARDADYFFRNESRTSNDMEEYLGLDHLAGYRRLARSLAKLNVDLALLDGRIDDALDGLECIVTSTAVVREVPSLITKLMELSILQLFFDSLSSVMSSAVLSSHQLDHLESLLKKINVERYAYRALLFEATLAVELDYDRVRASAAVVGFGSGRVRLWYYSGYLSLNRSIMLDDRLRLAENLRMPIDQWGPLLRGERPGRLPEFLTGLADVFGNPFVRWSHSILREEIRRRAALAAIGVERYLREHGRLPDRLDDLVPDFLDAVPLNPALGTPLEFVVRDDRYFIFGSVESHPVPNPIERRYDRPFDLGPVDTDWAPEPIEQDDFGQWGLRGQWPDQPDDLGHWTLRVQGPHRPIGFTVRFAGRDE